MCLNSLDQRLIAHRLFQRIEIGALHVLDDRKLERLAVGHLDHDDRHVVHAGALRRAPAPFAGDDLELIGRALDRAHHDRLDDAALPDRGRKLVELGVGEIAPRVARIGLDEFDRRLARMARALDDLGFLADVADQRGKPAAQSRSAVFGHDAFS